jgi:tetratricopeptide (TPR) repeat protein
MFHASLQGTLKLARSLAIITVLAAASPAFAFDSNGDSSSYGGGGSASSIDEARAYIDKGRYKDAIGVLRHIVSDEPRNADALNLLGYSLRKTGDHRNALGFYQKALKIRPAHRGANEYLGELYVETGNLDKALVQLATLEGICGTSCREYKALKKVIDAAS